MTIECGRHALSWSSPRGGIIPYWSILLLGDLYVVGSIKAKTTSKTYKKYNRLAKSPEPGIVGQDICRSRG
jgi:hypothetical protein